MHDTEVLAIPCSIVAVELPDSFGEGEGNLSIYEHQAPGSAVVLRPVDMMMSSFATPCTALMVPYRNYLSDSCKRYDLATLSKE